MIERALDSNNDLIIRNGSFATVSDGEQVVQHVRTRLQFYLGEWFLNLNAGTPWFQQVFVKPFNPVSVENIIKNRISNTPGITEITEFTIDLPDPSDRKVKVSFSANTEYGPVNVEEIFINE